MEKSNRQKNRTQKERKPRPPKRYNKVGIPIEGERKPKIKVLPGERDA